MSDHQANLQADILIVDDTPDNIRFLSTMLTEQGYGVRKALSGKMALIAVQKVLPDLILLDINMPEMGGYEVCQQLKQDPATATVPIIFLSALNDAEAKVKAFEVGGIDYISKPFQFEEVLARIQNQLQVKQLQTQLNCQNQELKKALKDLKNTQAQLVQRDKMVAIARLAAGIAHEVNNPINFIAGNIKAARSYIEDLLEVTHLYQQEYPRPPEPIGQKLDEIDFEFLQADMRHLLDSMQRGVDRVRELVLGLRSFSRLDEADVKAVDLHEGLDGALTFLHYRLDSRTGGNAHPSSGTTSSTPNNASNNDIPNHAPNNTPNNVLNDTPNDDIPNDILNNAPNHAPNDIPNHALNDAPNDAPNDALNDAPIALNPSLSSDSPASPSFVKRLPPVQVIKNYQDLPLITCYASRLNQVFLSLLENAIDALEARLKIHSSPDWTPKIWVKTQLKPATEAENEQVEIIIEDNGIGMNPEIQSHLFEPFFTTKSVGEGTGLSLSISYQTIVDLHHGKLCCYSTEGEGTQFRIMLPLFV